MLAVPVVLANAMFADLIGYSLPHSGPVTWISPVLGTVMYGWVRQAVPRRRGFRDQVASAIGAGTDVAIASAGVVLASDDPRSVLSVIELSRATYRKMIQNLSWAAGYNAISVPLAAGVLSPWGFTLPMEVGALLMSASTVVVAVNAQLLRRLDLRPARRGSRVAD